MRSRDVLDSVLEAVGDTPLVRLGRLGKGLPAEVCVKLECLNPGLSVKDRPALRILTDAIRTGTLRPRQTVIERTSGNMGTGLAIACAILGHPLVVVMSSGNSLERVRMLRALGAKVVRVPQVNGRPGQVTGKDLKAVEAVTNRMERRLGAFRADQFRNPSTVLAHFDGTGPEIWKQAGGRVDAFVSVAGSSGTFTGTVRFLKRRNPRLKAFAVEPLKAAILSGRVKTPGLHKLQGVGYASFPDLWDARLCDGYVQVADAETVRTARELALKEGIFCGFTSGANVSAALRVARRMPKGSRVVTVICDSGLKYLSTDLFP